jgi:hypothetical protein
MYIYSSFKLEREAIPYEDNSMDTDYIEATYNSKCIFTSKSKP